LDADNPLPPDLVIEIDITSFSTTRLAAYAELGISEVWLFNGQQLTFYHLQSGSYVESDRSLAFPSVPVTQITPFLARALTSSYPVLVREFRDWLQGLSNL
jgi:Uma2 family endonuclease